MTKKVFQMKAHKLAHDGAAEGEFEGKPVRVHGMLPGEEGVVEAVKRHGIWIGTLTEVSKASASRQAPREEHYLSCSPWQVMEYGFQAEQKKNILQELFSYYADAPNVAFTPADVLEGYRTKIEFSFTDRDGESTLPLSLAFHVRGGGAARVALPEGCVLASKKMNVAALMICEKLRALGVTTHELKTLIIRESKSTGKLLAVLFAKAQTVPQFPIGDIPDLAGFIAFHSSEKSPASVATKEIWRTGEDFLLERVGGKDIRYTWDSFFQNNVPMFEEAMKEIRKAVASFQLPVASKKPNILELYSGVGTIGLCIANEAGWVHGVEIVPNATLAAKENARLNGIRNYVAECLPAEKMDVHLLDGRDVLVLDPPRSGLHPKILDMIKEKKPAKIIYLSCNPETQARDYSVIKDLYQIALINGFDFYPQTPHLESLLIMRLR